MALSVQDGKWRTWLTSWISRTANWIIKSTALRAAEIVVDEKRTVRFLSIPSRIDERRVFLPGNG